MHSVQFSIRQVGGNVVISGGAGAAYSWWSDFTGNLALPEKLNRPKEIYPITQDLAIGDECHRDFSTAIAL
jgi:hypothetical protein